MKTTRTSQVPDLLKRLESGVRDVFQSESYQAYLTAMARFHHYSINNQLLIYLQRPDAERVASVRTWNSLGRIVRKGERGIKILVPTPVIVQRATEENEEKKILRFKVGHVFAYDQTEGEDLPECGAKEVQGSFEYFGDFVQAVKRVSPVAIRFSEIDGHAKGYYSPTEREIVIREGMPEAQTAKTMLHELVHSIRDQNQGDGNEPFDRQTEEVIAESVAFVVSNALLNIDTSCYSWSYVCTWSTGKDVRELMSSLSSIREISVLLIEKLEAEMECMKIKVIGAVG